MALRLSSPISRLVAIATTIATRAKRGDEAQSSRAPGIDTSEYHHYFHTDLETPQTVPWTGLEASTRAYAKIIDEVNKRPLSTFQRPEEPTPTRQ